MQDLSVCLDLVLFFSAGLSELSRSSLVDRDCVTYLANLLADRAHSDVSREPLSLRLMDSPGVLALQSVGDDALFLSGFYPEHLSCRGLDVRSAVGWGRSAYLELARRTSHRLFVSLSGEFEPMRVLLSSLREEFEEHRQNKRLVGSVLKCVYN